MSISENAASQPFSINDERANKIAWLLRAWRGKKSLREVSQETGIGISTLSRHEGGRLNDGTEAILKLLGLTWESLDNTVICWFPQPCRHQQVKWLDSVRVAEVQATSWFEYDDDGYPNEVFGDKQFTWEKHYDVCLDCGKIREFDGYAMVESYPEDVPYRIRRLAKSALEEAKS